MNRAEFSLPASLEGPTSAVVRDAGVGELNLRWTNPKNTMDLMDAAIDNGGSIYYLIDWKINDGPWNITPHSQSPNYNADVDYFRILFRCDQLNKPPVYSPFSNIASTKVDAYSNASSWAKPELDKADEYGLIPHVLTTKS